MIAAAGKKAILTQTAKPDRVAVNAATIPAAMREANRWLVWRFEWRANTAGGKWQKIPLKVDGTPGSSTDSRTWSDFDSAYQAAKNNRTLDGIGFVLGDGWAGVDLDDSRDVDTGVLTPLAESIVRRFGSYTEVSPTGTGCKIIVRGEKPQGRCVAKDPDIEVYSSGRYFTITGWQVEETEPGIADGTDALAWLQHAYIDPPRHVEPQGGFDGLSDIELASDALANVPLRYASNHADWVRVGLAAKSVSESLLRDWIEWSSRGEGFVDAADCERKWKSLTPNGQIGIGTIVHLAKEGGWLPPRRATQTRAPRIDPQQRTASPEKYFASIRDHYRLDEPMTLRDLLAADFRDDYLIEGCLVANQPAVTAGASKTLKTTIEVARCLSLVTGEPFLGHFTVNRPCSVFFATAESGKATVQRTFRAMAAQMGIDPAAISDDRLKIVWWVPRVSNAELLDYFTYEAERSGADVCIIDPLYKVLDDQQSSMVLNGQQLTTLGNRILDMGATPILVDHAKRSSTNAKEHEPLELEDISGAGKAEYFRQWMLLSRRSKFEPCELGEANTHDLWLTFGGSAGHASVWAADIAEQVQSNRERQYEITVRSRRDALDEATEAKQSQTRSKAEERAAAADARLQRKADELIEKVFRGDRTLALTTNDIEARLSGINGKEAAKVAGIALNDGRLRWVADVVMRNNGRKYGGYMLSDSIGAANQWNG